MLHRPDNEERPSTTGLLPPFSASIAGSALIAGDTLAVLLCGYLTYMFLIGYTGVAGLYTVAVVFVWLTTLILMHFGGLYRYQVATRPLRYMMAIVVAVGTAYLFFLAAAFTIKVSETFSRLWFAAFAASSMISILVVRTALARFFGQLLGYRRAKRNVAIIGTGKQSERLMALCERLANQPIEICGVFTNETLSARKKKQLSDDLSGDLATLVSQARAGQVDDVVIALPWSDDDMIMELVAKLRELPVNVYLGSDLIGFRTQVRTPPSHFGAIPIFQVIGKPMSDWDAVIKSIEDYVLAVLILILISPLLLIVGLVIWITDGRPILFKQERTGFNNKTFHVYKFRTMKPASEPVTKTEQATVDDMRVTPVGRFLRRWSIDELPQILNVMPLPYGRLLHPRPELTNC